MLTGQALGQPSFPPREAAREPAHQPLEQPVPPGVYYRGLRAHRFLIVRHTRS